MHIISDLDQMFKMKANVLRVGDVAFCCVCDKAILLTRC